MAFDLAPPPFPPRPGGPRARRTIPWLALLAALLALLVLLSLGTWQLYRRAWKHDLIARVEARIHAPPSAPPFAPSQAPSAALSAALPAVPPAAAAVRANGPQRSLRDDEYRHVTVSGYYLPERSTQVLALTDLGSGFWILSPLQDGQGHTILINRGFVSAADRSAAAPPPAGLVTVTGLLRLSEASGRWLRRNDPAAERWYARDVSAIGAARALTGLAPFFIDADAEPAVRAAGIRAQQDGAPRASTAGHVPDIDARQAVAGIRPVAGLTVTQFSDNHLIYALTWYTLAVMVAAGMVLLVRAPRQT